MKTLLLCAAIATAVAACATTKSPTGRTQYIGAVSQEQLNQLGARAFAEVKAKKAQTTDARQRTYVGCVVNTLVAQLPAQWRTTGWEYAVFVDKEPNAFALPGGKVGVYTGIFTVAKNQDQLAAVIAHEIGHVISRHHEERITNQMRTETGLGLISALLGARYGEGVAQTTNQLGGMAAQGLFVLPNSRTQESEADVVGQQLMAQAGFDPRAAVNLWQNMIAANGSGPPQWLSTHPDPNSRLKEMNNRATGLMPVYQQARASGHAPKCG
ncbi:M48 family metallopeptidase [Pseudoluteimonas lycopersici]|uniref:M48 family metallopeptidase n=1 Tax=Pseudoluteimonas lycopersici TaxID=1324796 RepID=A0A516V694_9GAMM|nr:M48 family metallopeptidase [Lysobacter lycopersici]QDQ74059.1 M48 family metallopeptidase [Lysobacter lycopersici]